MALGTLVLALSAMGCGSTHNSTPSRPSPPAPTGVLAPQVMSASCLGLGTSTSSGGRAGASSCLFILSDGRRFKCSGKAFARLTPSPNALEHAPGCVALTRLVIPSAERPVIAAIQTARDCMTKKGFRVSGGPVFPQQSPTSPDGELIVGSARGAAFIAFYTDASRAARLEPQIAQNARQTGGQVERRGSVTVLFIRHPAGSLRTAVLACAFG